MLHVSCCQLRSNVAWHDLHPVLILFALTSSFALKHHAVSMALALSAHTPRVQLTVLHCE